jgi:hypothetical protein
VRLARIGFITDLFLQRRELEKQRSWKEKVNEDHGKWIAIGGAGLGTPLAMHMWL